MNIIEFLGLTRVESLAGVIVFFGLLFGISRLPKKKFTFAARVLIGTGIGTVYGLIVWGLSGRTGAYAADLGRWFSLVGNGYVSLFQLLIAPAIFVAGVRLVIHTPLVKTETPLIKWKKWVNTLMLAVSALIGACLGLCFKVGVAPGADTAVFSWEIGEGQKITDSIAHLIPSGIVFDFLTGNVVGIFVFAVLIGIAARRMSGKYMDTVKPFLDVTDAAFSVIMSVCKAVIAYKPMGAAAVMAAFTAAYGPAFLLMLVKMLAVLCAASLIMLAVQLVLCAVSGVSPTAFFRAGKAAMKKALVTRSGSACLPDAQEALTAGLGLKKEITDEVSAYAISSGMQGCGAMFPAMAAVFAAGLSGLTMTPALVFGLVVVIVLVSYGITGVPGTATMAEFGAVMGSGITGAVNGLGPMIAVDPIGDVPRTLINVTGCMTNAIIVERRVRE